MPRRKYASKDFSEPSTPHEGPQDQGGARRSGVADLEGYLSQEAGPRFALCEALVRWASERNDGWLRIVPAASGEVHWKWRFTSGRWKGHYIYVLQKHETAAFALGVLAGKLDLVDSGALKPSLDVYS